MVHLYIQCISLYTNAFKWYVHVLKSGGWGMCPTGKSYSFRSCVRAKLRGPRSKCYFWGWAFCCSQRAARGHGRALPNVVLLIGANRRKSILDQFPWLLVVFRCFLLCQMMLSRVKSC